jgi:hypothetical protein
MDALFIPRPHDATSGSQATGWTAKSRKNGTKGCAFFVVSVFRNRKGSVWHHQGSQRLFSELFRRSLEDGIFNGVQRCFQSVSRIHNPDFTPFSSGKLEAKELPSLFIFTKHRPEIVGKKDQPIDLKGSMP